MISWAPTPASTEGHPATNRTHDRCQLNYKDLDSEDEKSNDAKRKAKLLGPLYFVISNGSLPI